MKWLVIYFLISGSWVAGDFVKSEGWSSVEYPTEAECREHADYVNQNFRASENFSDNAIAVCMADKPTK